MFSSSGTRATIGVDARDGQAQGAAHVADRRPGRQRAERADLRHVRPCRTSP